MPRSGWFLVTVGCLAACADAPLATDQSGVGLEADLASAQVVSTNVSTPINLVAFVECANEGLGESISLSGMLHLTFHSSTSASGNWHVRTQVQPQGVSGTGILTGAKYVGTGGDRESFQVNTGSTHTFINNFRMIGQGKAGNFLVHETFHVTVNANGETTVERTDQERVSCK